MQHAGELYDTIGLDYTATRREDARLAAAIRRALGAARTVVNIGAGAGAYEPDGCAVTAVEPSRRMNAQRTRPALEVVCAHAEALPFADASFDVAMSVLSDHHWPQRALGLQEMARVARDRAVLFTWDQSLRSEFWLTRDYLTGLCELPGMALEQIALHLGATHVEPFPIPHDFQDGFLAAYWRRPQAYLDPRVRAGISVFYRLPDEHVRRALRRLQDDLASGRWRRRNASLLDEDEHDLGFRILVAQRRPG